MEIHTPGGRNFECLENPLEQNPRKNSQVFMVKESHIEGSMDWEKLWSSCERDCDASKIRMRVEGEEGGEEILVDLHVKIRGKCCCLFLPTKRAAHWLQHSPRTLLLFEIECLHCCWIRQEIRNEEISPSDGSLNEQIVGGGALGWELWGPTDWLGMVNSSHSSQRWPRALRNVPWKQLTAISFPPGRLCLLMWFGGWWKGSCYLKAV